MPSSEQVQTLYGIPMRQQNLTLFKIKKNDLSKLRKKQIFWEEHSSERLPLSFDGVPFMILGREVRECCHGPDRHRAEKIKPTQTRNLGKFADLYLSGEEMDRCWTSQDIKKERLRLRLKLLSLGINAEVPLQDPSRLEVKQALDEFSESPREGLDMTARMNQTTNDVDLPDLEVPVAPVEWSSLESEQDQESIMEKHQRKGNLRQKRPKDVLSKKGQKRLQKIKEKNETLVQFLLSKEVKAYLLKIMQGKPASNLHAISTGMSQRARRAIKHSGFGPIDDDEQIDRVVEGYIGYIQELKLDTMKHIDYVFDVWVPEAIMMFYKKKGYSKAKAEEMFNKGVTRTKEEMEVIMHREFKSYRKYKPK
ncbi:hypothetical protein MAR_026883 [Mya arenaria]|uniref:PWWP domain-containing protein n=1 Tax=Mya arenaria TaxID=6604 RepID=A0ABY7ERW6_MYAAR|nr:hypothetical protein MAR_026883 [Mya arenaria]